MSAHQAAIEAIAELAVKWHDEAKALDARADFVEGTTAIAMLQRAQMCDDHATAIKRILAKALEASDD